MFILSVVAQSETYTNFSLDATLCSLRHDGQQAEVATMKGETDYMTNDDEADVDFAAER